jgi:hypothetical protein
MVGLTLIGVVQTIERESWIFSLFERKNLAAGLNTTSWAWRLQRRGGRHFERCLTADMSERRGLQEECARWLFRVGTQFSVNKGIVSGKQTITRFLGWNKELSPDDVEGERREGTRERESTR